MRSADDLQVVVGKADGAERRPSSHGNPDVDVRQVRPQQRRHERRRQDQQAAHRRRAGLRLVRGRAFLPDHLADLELPQLPDQPRPERRLIASADRLAAAVRNVM